MTTPHEQQPEAEYGSGQQDPTAAMPSLGVPPATVPARKLPAWLVPTSIGAAVLVALVCFVIGAAIGGASSDPEPATMTTPSPELIVETVEVEVPVDPSDDRVAELDDREAELDDRETELDEREADLDGREEDLDDRAESLTETETEIEAGTIPGNGVYLVGEDIEPGTYRNEGGGTCYWARLSGTSGELGDVIANGLPSGQAVVTIRASDVAFETSGCGDWRRQ